MKTSILVVSYLQDLPWLRHCLDSIAKFANWFRETVVLVPQEELAEFERKIVLPSGARWTTYPRTVDRSRWHLHHQAMKCHADELCPKADFVLHMDSDCIFTKSIWPTDYIEAGKAVMLMEPYSNLSNCPWKPVVEEVLKEEVLYEFMRRHPQVNPVGVYADLRSRIQKLHNQAFDEFVLSRKPDFPWGFTEHNVIGAFAWTHPKWREYYHWIDLSVQKRPQDKLIQFWSHSPPEKPQETPAGLRCVPVDVIRSILGCPVAKEQTLYPITRDVFGYWLNDQGLLGEGVEVGCAYGHNAGMILSQWNGIRLYLVDPWEQQSSDVYREKTDHVDYRQWYKDCCALAKRDARTIICRKFSPKAAALFDDGSLDFVFVDGNHAYKAVLEDLDAWWPKVKSGGMFCGHDFYQATDPPHFCEVQSAVTRWMQEHKQAFSVTACTSWWARKA